MPIIEIPMAEDSEITILKSTKKWVKTLGLVDLQVNGFGGVDFNTPGITQNSLEHSLEAMLASGVTTCLPTIITASETHLQSCLADLETARNFSALAKTMIAGYHLEGPFISTLPGFSSCHPVQEMGAVNPEMFLRLQDCSRWKYPFANARPGGKWCISIYL